MLNPEILAAVRSLRTEWVERNVTRRHYYPDGSWEDTTRLERIHPFEISDDPRGEFVFVSNFKDPDKPAGIDYASLGDLPEKTTQLFAQMLVGNRVIDYADFLIPVPNGGTKLAKAISEQIGIELLPLFTKIGIGKEKKIVLNRDYAQDLTQNTSPSRLTLIEDTLTTGESSLRSVNLLAPLIEARKVEIVGLASILNREEGADERFAKLGIPVCSIFTRPKLYSLWSGMEDPAILTPKQYAIGMSREKS